MTTAIHGRSVVLRGFRDDEATLLVDLYSRVGGGQTMAVPVTEETVRAKIAASGEWSDAPWGMILAIDASGDLVGEIQVRGGPAAALPPGVYELGIELYDDARRGRGIGSDAIAALSAYLFDHQGANRVQLSTDVDNEAMRTVAERAGFLFEGVMRSFFSPQEGEPPHDYALYGRTRDDHRDGS
jgi:ribosomal-protein-alanine N-acetyltransferase